MDLLIPTINQMIFLFAFILIGYILVKTKVVEPSAATILSKLENNVFIPCLVLGTFINNFTVDKLSSAWKMLLISFAIEFTLIPIMIQVGKLCSKDRYMQKIYIYGFCFANFGFMGNAVVNAIFPDLFADYIIFTLPLYVLIFLWAVPSLLVEQEGDSLKSRLKSLCNPMFVAMLVGMVLGIARIKMPAAILSVITVSGNCMSPIAMLLTGITIAGMDMKDTLKKIDIYIVSAIRLVVVPLIFLGLFAVIPAPETIVVCTICSVAMPLGLNTIVIPSAYGKDTSAAAAMTLVSHLCSIVTIPVIFILLRMI